MTAKARKKTEFFNKKARFDYEISDSFEAGIALVGVEIKAIRNGRVNLTGSYAKVIGGEVYWVGGNIQLKDGESSRTKKLLLHQAEINRLIGKTQAGFTLIPLKLYMKRGRAKIELGLGKGLKKYDKREKLKQQDQKRDTERIVK